MNATYFRNNSSEFNNFENVTIKREAFFEKFDSIIIIIYVVLLISGSAINLIHILTLVRSRRNGVLSLILQISLVDIFSTYVAVTEIFTLFHNTWYFPPEWCPFFKGTEILLNTLVVYLLVCFNFHVISIWNLHELEAKKSNKNPLTACDSSEDESNESLVGRHENANRLVTIDYRKRKEDISIIFPASLIWIVSLSLSVPNYTLSSTLKLKSNYTLCAVVDMYYGQALQYSLLIFKIILPTFLLFLTLVILFIKLRRNSRSDNIVTKKMFEIKKLLIFGIVISAVYLLTSFQRQCLQFIHILSYSFYNNSINNFKMPPLYNNFLNQSTSVYLAMLHYSGCTLRSILYPTVLPKFSYLVRNKIFICCKVEK